VLVGVWVWSHQGVAPPRRALAKCVLVPWCLMWTVGLCVRACVRCAVGRGERSEKYITNFEFLRQKVWGGGRPLAQTAWAMRTCVNVCVRVLVAVFAGVPLPSGGHQRVRVGQAAWRTFAGACAVWRVLWWMPLCGGHSVQTQLFEWCWAGHRAPVCACVRAAADCRRSLRVLYPSPTASC
jgi:hypothetical protein